MTKLMPKAMVLAAGLGTRMRPLTDRLPKPLVKVAGVTLIDRALDWLTAAGTQEVIVNSHYYAALLEAHLAKRRTPVIHVSHEPVVLDTGGGVRRALPLLCAHYPLPLREGAGGGGVLDIGSFSLDTPSPRPSPTGGEGEVSTFFVTNSDVICIDGKVPALHRLLQVWDDSVDAVLLLHPREKAVGFTGPGDFFLTPEGNVRWRGEHAEAPYVFTGTQLVHPRLFKDAPEGAFSIWRLSEHTKLPDGTMPRIRGVIHDGDWLHVGSPGELKQAESWLAEHGYS